MSTHAPDTDKAPVARSPGASCPKRGAGLFSIISRFFETWRFGVFSLSLLAFFNAYVAMLILWPPSPGVMGRFAADFKKWCSVVDPVTGEMNYFYAAMLFVGPVVLGVILLTLWGGSIRRGFRVERRGVAAYVLASLLITVGLGSALPQVGVLAAEDENPEFPARELRLSETPPSFSLVDQDGKTVSLDDLRGRVVLLTAAYACCVQTCPLIVRQAREVLETLSERRRKNVTVLVITLDPENDTPKTLGDMARRNNVRSPLFRFLSGTPDQVNPTLDALGVARQRDKRTGVIAHANLFTLVDRQGRIAYRFSLGALQQRWMTEAFQVLLAEKYPNP